MALYTSPEGPVDSPGAGLTAQKEKGPGQHFRTPLSSIAEWSVWLALLHAVYEHLDAALALCGLILVNDALGSGLVELAAGLVCGCLRSCLVALVYGCMDLLDVGLEFGANRTIADTSLLGGTDALLLRFDVCHVLTLSVIYIEASTLRHGCSKGQLRKYSIQTCFSQRIPESFKK